MKFYIAGALTHSADLDKSRKLYEEIGRKLEEGVHEAYIPHLHTDPELDPDASPKEVYRMDMDAIKDADMVVAILDQPSLGVGAEVAEALCRGKEVVGFASTSAKVSRYIRGLLEFSPRGRFMWYTDVSDLLRKLRRL